MNVTTLDAITRVCNKANEAIHDLDTHCQYRFVSPCIVRGDLGSVTLSTNGIIDSDREVRFEAPKDWGLCAEQVLQAYVSNALHDISIVLANDAAELHCAVQAGIHDLSDAEIAQRDVRLHDFEKIAKALNERV